MYIFKCKMCGGTIEFNSGETVGVCDSCGTKQTLPRLDDDRRANLYERANHFRRNNDFDKAMGIYEAILNEDGTDAEAYWSLVLCRYGIEYVEDPASHKQVPTVNRAQYTSVFDDEDYKAAIQYADFAQKQLYEAEAEEINEIQKGILQISQKEDPFDVFICYKETDEHGRRTQDSVLATELYKELVKDGFKVFFSRITLEDKLGTAYEPYIFAALNSARIMVVIGTKAEYFNAVWVKNEWSRYLAMIKSGEKKTLIPAFRDMDISEIPREFSHLQAQDMSKLGFMQDLTRGIRKILCTDDELSVRQQAAYNNSQALLERGFLALEDSEWEIADSFFENALNQDAKCAKAYLGKLMVELRINRESDLAETAKPIETSSNYQKAIRFGDETLTSRLRSYADCAAARGREAKSGDVETTSKTSTEKKRGKVIVAIAIGIVACCAILAIVLYRTKVEAPKKSYEEAIALKNSGQYEEAIAMFTRLGAYQDSAEQINACNVAVINAQNTAQYNAAVDLMNAGEFGKAIDAFVAIESYSDSHEKIEACKRNVYQRIVNAVEQQNYAEAIAYWSAFCDTNDSMRNYEDIENYILYANALIAYNAAEPDFEAVQKILEQLPSGFLNADELVAVLAKPESIKRIEEASVGNSVFLGHFEQDNVTSNGAEEIEWIVLDQSETNTVLISKYILDGRRIQDNNSESSTWETCSLRAWLNGEFYDEAFTTEEKEWIPLVEIKNEDNMYTNIRGGNDTFDRVYILSIYEAEEYFSSGEEMKTDETPYASPKNSIFRCWWLRTPGQFNGCNAIYSYWNKYNRYESEINVCGYSSDLPLGIRPVINIKH